MEKKKNYYLIRWLVFAAGLFLNALSVALFNKGALGTSPISSIPYVLNQGVPLTLGQLETILNFCLIAGQILLLRKQFKLIQLLQIPIALTFGFFIDFWMMILTGLEPASYMSRLLVMLLGVVVGGIAVGIIVSANVTMLCGEAFVTAWCQVLHTDFGRTKIGFDCALTAGAVVISLIMFRSIVGVREGTLVAAIFVGIIANRVIAFGKRKLPWASAL